MEVMVVLVLRRSSCAFAGAEAQLHFPAWLLQKILNLLDRIFC